MPVVIHQGVTLPTTIRLLKVGPVVSFAIQGHTVFSPEAMRKLEHDHAESIDKCSNTKNRTTASLETHDKYWLGAARKANPQEYGNGDRLPWSDASPSVNV